MQRPVKLKYRKPEENVLLTVKKLNSLLEHGHEEIGGVVSVLLTAIDGSSVEESFKLLDLF
jgi:hypothetical protein